MLFTPKLIATNNNGDKITLNSPGAFGQHIQLVPRAQCAFRRYRLKGTGRPASKAVILRAMNEARSGHDKFKLIKDPDGKNATVWSYSSKNISGMRSLPESLCAKPMASGYRLVGSLLGYEGQIWDENVLLASRWWPQEPSEGEWASFARVASVDTESDTPLKPPVQSAMYRNDFPLIGFDENYFDDFITPGRVGAFASIIALFSIGFMSAKYGFYKTELARVEAETNEVSEQANLILSKRRRALANVTRIQKFKSVDPQSSVISPLGNVSNVLEGQTLTVRDLRLRGDEIEIRMEGSGSIRVPELVAQLESQNALIDVSVTNDRQNSLLIKGRLKGAVSDDNSVGNVL